MGGDVLAGTNFVDALKVFEHDNDTEGIVIIGEIGGEAEIDAAEWIKAYRKRSTNPKYVSIEKVNQKSDELTQTYFGPHWGYPRGAWAGNGPCRSFYLTRGARRLD